MHPAEAADPNDEAPDWDALVETLEAVTSQAGYALPKKPTLEGTAAMKHAIKVAYEQAVDVQQQRIQQCKQRVEEQELGKVYFGGYCPAGTWPGQRSSEHYSDCC